MSVLIKGAKVVDGSGSPTYRADVLVLGDKISAIGDFGSGKKADTIIDGIGGYLMPGFIDINTDSDHYLTLFRNPKQKDFLLQGVTSIFGGMCGYSLAPLIYGSLELTREWADPRGINVSWHSVKELLQTLNNLKLGVNFGTLTGHTSLRKEITKNNRVLSKSEIMIFEKMLKKSLIDGSFGMSAGLDSFLAENIYNEESLRFSKLVKEFHGVYAIHLRSYTDKLEQSINQAISISDTGISTIISHFRPFLGYEKKFNKALNQISLKTASSDIHFDIDPYDSTTMLLSDLLPDVIKSENDEEVLKRLDKDGAIKKLISFWEKNNFDLESILIIDAPHHKYLIGKTLVSFASNRELEIKEALIELLKLTKLKATIIIKNINPLELEKAIFHDQSLIASNSTSFELSKDIIHERSRNTFPRFLELSDGKIGIESAVHKITGLPARIFNLKNRGLIREGLFADLVLMKGNKVDSVLINGKVAVKEGILANASAGRPLIHNAPQKR